MPHLEVEMVGGLVEQQQVGAFGHEDGQRQARPFAAGEMDHRFEHAVAAKAETAEVIAPPLFVPLRARADLVDAVGQRDQRGVARIEPVDFELREIADDEIGRGDAVAAGGGNAPEMSFMSVDLPAPLRPRMPMRSPGFTERPTPLMTCVRQPAEAPSSVTSGCGSLLAAANSHSKVSSSW